LGISAPAECLNKINPLLCRDNEANMFVTVFYAVINIHTGEMTYSSAGHNPPYIINPDGSIQTLVDGHNIPLGIIDTFKYKSKTKILERSAALVLFTDGITEAIDEDKNFFAEPRLEASLKIHAFENPKEITTSIIEEVKDFEGKMPQTDDITMMVIRRK
ncbi:MAG: PP2C family protein-serine/threonine phosphatase, partial [Bacteroidota bacterium]